MPRLRATSISSLESSVKVTSPSTSDAASPASSSAASTHSHASCSSVRPDSLENSVWPIPAIAAFPASVLNLRSGQPDLGGPADVLAEVVDRGERDLDDGLVAVLAHLGHLAGVRQRVPGVHRHAEPDRELADHRVGPGPVGEEPAAVAGVREDVHEDVRRALRLRVLAVVVHRHEVARRDRAGDDHRRGHVDHERRQLVADPMTRRRRRRSATPPAGTPAASGRPRSPRTRPRPARPSRRRPTRRRRGSHESPALLQLHERRRRIRLEPRVLRVAHHAPPTGSSPAPTTRSASTPASGTAGTSGRGGWRSAPHPSQRWTSRRRSRSPSQKNCVSGETVDGASRVGRVTMPPRPGGRSGRTSGCGTSACRPARRRRRCTW